MSPIVCKKCGKKVGIVDGSGLCIICSQGNRTSLKNQTPKIRIISRSALYMLEHGGSVENAMAMVREIAVKEGENDLVRYYDRLTPHTRQIIINEISKVFEVWKGEKVLDI